MRGVWLIALVFAGCGTSMYPYRVTNNDCSCEIFHVNDEQADVEYTFSAVYSLRGVMSTRITVDIQNDNADTLDLSLAYVKISSRNIPYMYNDKFLPVTMTGIPPGAKQTLTLEGEVEDAGQSDPWLAIAGEELTLTLKGIRLNGSPIATQTIRFIPQNPKLSSFKS